MEENDYRKTGVIPSSKFFRSTVQPQMLEVHNFRGLPFSKISRKQFSRTKDAVSISTVF